MRNKVRTKARYLYEIPASESGFFFSISHWHGNGRPGPSTLKPSKYNFILHSTPSAQKKKIQATYIGIKHVAGGILRLTLSSWRPGAVRFGVSGREGKEA